MEENKLAKWLEEQYDQGHTDGEQELSKHLNVLDKMSLEAVDADQLFLKIKEKVTN